jgi:hypothetical protein
MEQPVTGSSAHLALDAWLVEYKCLRSEIEWLIDGGAKYQNLAVTLMGLIFTAIAWIVKEAPVLLVPTLLVIPFLFCLLGFLYCRQHEEVYVVAAYLKDYLRPRVRSLIGEQTLWGWEEFKVQCADAQSTRLKLLSSAGFVFILRSMLFVIPSVACLTASVICSIAQGFYPFSNHMLHPTPALLTVWFFFDLTAIVILIVYLLSTRHLSRRIVRVDSIVLDSAAIRSPHGTLRDREGPNNLS